MNAPNKDGEMIRCIICEETRSEGISIFEQFICGECEAEIVRTDVQDAKYPFFITQMKRAWYKKNA